MNWDVIEGNWKQFKGHVKEQWGKLTDDNLDTIAGKRDQLTGRIQESYGIMVNYLYDHDSIEANHEAFVHDRTIVRSPDVDALLKA